MHREKLTDQAPFLGSLHPPLDKRRPLHTHFGAGGVFVMGVPIRGFEAFLTCTSSRSPDVAGRLCTADNLCGSLNVVQTTFRKFYTLTMVHVYQEMTLVSRDQSIQQSIQPTNQPIHPSNQSVNQSTNQSSCYGACISGDDSSISQSINPAIHSTKQSIHQINQSTNQPINLLVM